MAVQVFMPKWGLTMTEGKITRWFKKEGDQVVVGEPLFEVETSKITNKVESPATGILFQILVPAGETVPVKTLVAVIAEPGEELERITGPSALSETLAPKPETEIVSKPSFVRATPAARRLANEWGLDLAAIAGSGPEGRVTEQDVRRHKEQLEAAPAISPQAKALAEKEGIDLATVQGTGEGGRITKVDVLRAVEAKKKALTGQEPQGAEKPGLSPGTVLPLTGIRKIIADNMMASLHQSAQLTVFVEVDVTELLKLRDHLRGRFSSSNDPKIGMNELICYAVCRALQRVPIMNSWLTEEGIRIHEAVHLGIAVALPQGLIVPNVKNAHQKGLLELSRDIRELVTKARENRLTVDEIQGGTFTVTNVSRQGVDGFTPILNPPETGILGVGRVVLKPAVFQNQIRIRSFMTLSLTFDHRVTDGVPAMTFLRTLADYLEEPATLIA